MTTKNCTHLDQIKDVSATTKGCKECEQLGDTWVQLRVCLTCGHVGCCDSSKNKHATAHFHETNHAIMESFGEGTPENPWRWCYVDEMYL